MARNEQPGCGLHAQENSMWKAGQLGNPNYSAPDLKLSCVDQIDRAPAGGVAGWSWPELDNWLGPRAQAAGMRRGRACGSSLRLASFSRLM